MTPSNEAAPRRRLWLTGAFLLGFHVAIGAACAPALAQPPARSTGPGGAITRMQAPGPEGEELASRTGRWDVVITLRLTPDAKPIVTRGVIAERSMVGNYLEEVMKPAPGSRTPDFRRIAYLTYNRVEGRWQYVSLDTRFPVGIMPARSFEKPVGGVLVLEFDTLAFVGFGAEVEGRMIQSNFVIERDSVDHEVGQQYWTQADGTGRRWLAVQYEYTRRR
jgi:hypothetical protein